MPNIALFVAMIFSWFSYDIPYLWSIKGIPPPTLESYSNMYSGQNEQNDNREPPTSHPKYLEMCGANAIVGKT